MDKNCFCQNKYRRYFKDRKKRPDYNEIIIQGIMKMPYKKLIFIVLLPLFVLSFVSCSTVSQIGTDNWRDYFKPSASKEEITRDFNLYRGKWWNYYVRGRWYADGGYYNEAIQDFKRSVSLRSRDERSARSYGLHFWEYFG